MTIETILIVDDEDTVRQTVLGWLTNSDELRCKVLSAGDAEQALLLANQHPIDLALLDWNLGAGNDGLRLLEDLVDFHPDLVAILMTGYAQQATPLEALRKGVRDYLDKGSDFHRKTVVDAVNRQLHRIRPAKRQREFYKTLAVFRESVEKVLPLVQSAAALNDPVPLPEAVRSLFRFLMRGTRASDGALLVRHLAQNGVETLQAFDAKGQHLETSPIPFSSSLAASVVSFGQPCLLRDPEHENAEMQWQPFEKGRKSILAAPVSVAPGVHAILELFDKPTTEGFNEDDRRLISAASEFSVELLRQALAERQTQRMLFDTVDAALKTSEEIAATWDPSKSGPTTPPSEQVLAQLHIGLSSSSNAVIESGASLRLAEAIRVLAVRHGPEAVVHCIQLVESVRKLLDHVTGSEN